MAIIINIWMDVVLGYWFFFIFHVVFFFRKQNQIEEKNLRL